MEDCTSDPLVREAFKQATYVSTGIATGNIEVALPGQLELCGIQYNSNSATKRSLINNISYSYHSDITDHELQQFRRSELFGISNILKLKGEVLSNLEKENHWYNLMSITLPLVAVRFSVTQIVEGIFNFLKLHI